MLSPKQVSYRKRNNIKVRLQSALRASQRRHSVLYAYSEQYAFRPRAFEILDAFGGTLDEDWLPIVGWLFPRVGGWRCRP